MMKKLLTAVLLMTLFAYSAASADTLDMLKPLWLNALENMREEKDAAGAAIAEPKVISGDAQLEVVCSAVYMDHQYETEAYIYAELKNTGESIIRINGATLTIQDAGGRQTGRREYAAVTPDVVMPGESLYISEWLYDFISDLSRMHTIEVSFERSEYSRKRIGKIQSAKAYIDGNYLYAELANTTQEPLFEVGVIAVATDADGKILDILHEQTYSGVGVAPGSTIIFRRYLQQHAVDIPGAVCEAAGYHYVE